jgi:hypothetical protein
VALQNGRLILPSLRRETGVEGKSSDHREDRRGIGVERPVLEPAISAHDYQCLYRLFKDLGGHPESRKSFKLQHKQALKKLMLDGSAK